jgi:EpsI family protein
MSVGRFLVYATLCAATAFLSRPRPVQANADVTRVPYRIGAWQGTDGPPLAGDEVAELGADRYLNRTYRGVSATPIDLYAAYYATPETGATWHSPLNCLPGTGWEAADIATVRVLGPDGRDGSLRRVVVEKGGEKVVVLYWYQIHARMVASEMTGKLFLLADSLRMGRSDAWFVRIAVPAQPTVEAAEHAGFRFTRDALPALARLWS